MTKVITLTIVLTGCVVLFLAVFLPAPIATASDCFLQNAESEKWCAMGNGEYRVSMLKGRFAGQTCFVGEAGAVCGVFNDQVMNVTRIAQRTGSGSLAEAKWNFVPVNAVCSLPREGQWSCEVQQQQQQRQTDLSGAAAILQGFADGFRRYGPPPPVKCQTRQTVTGRFPQWETVCE